MPCNLKSREAMAEAGWTDADIELMETEVKLARAKANVEAARAGLTASEQKTLMDDAEQQARKTVHDKLHAKLDAVMADIKALGAAKKLLVH